MEKTRYQNSVCGEHRGWLHRWATIKYTEKGELVRCERCGMKLHLANDMPRHIILSYMVRSVLRADDSLFEREYGKI